MSVPFDGTGSPKMNAVSCLAFCNTQEEILNAHDMVTGCKSKLAMSFWNGKVLVLEVHFTKDRQQLQGQ